MYCTEENEFSISVDRMSENFIDDMFNCYDPALVDRLRNVPDVMVTVAATDACTSNLRMMPRL